MERENGSIVHANQLGWSDNFLLFPRRHYYLGARVFQMSLSLITA